MEIKPGVYEHYKGHKYRVIGVAKRSKTLEDFVVCEALYDNELSKLWIWSAETFLEDVEVDGQKVPRFKFISEA
jgi:hypothetical protein